MATPNIVPKADQEGGLGTAAKSWGKLFIENAAAGGTAAVTISNLDVDKVALDINANNTSENVIDITATALNDNSKAGIFLNVKDDSNDILMRSSNNSADFTTIKVGANAATTITTKDGVGAVAHFEIAADGDIILDSAAAVLLESTGDMTLDSGGQILLEPAAGSNILLDGTIAVDAGVVTGATSITSTAISCNIIQGTLSTASQPNVTGVGTIGTGVWEGTTIKTAYIGDDQVTEDKLANTLLAEIDANTAKVTNSDQSKSDIDGLGITTVGTIDTGVWNGTAIASARLDADTAHLTTAQTFTGSKTMATDVKLNFRDANAYIHSNAANDLAIVATDVEIAATNVILDAATAIKLEGNTTLAGNLSVTGTTHAFASSTANRPVFSILSTADDATSGTLRLWKNRGQDGGGGANENGDKIGVIEFLGGNDAQEPIYYGKILVEALEVDDTDEAGKVSLQVAESNGTVSGLTTGLLIEGSDNTTDGEVNVEIAAGAASITKINGSLRPKGQIVLMRSAFKDDIGTTKHYIPLQSELEQTSATHEMNSFVAPFAGKLLKIMFRGSGNFNASSAEFTFTLEQIPRNVAFNTTATTLKTIAIDGPTNNTTDPNMVIADFVGGSGTNAFTAGDIIQVGIESDTDVTGGSSKFFFTLVFEFDFSGLA